MADKIHPKLKPLVHDLKESGIRYFLASADFERDCIESGVANSWDSFYQQAVENRGFIATNFDHKAYDSENALIYLLEWAISLDDEQHQLNNYLSLILTCFIKWSPKELFFDDIFKDLKLLNINKNLISDIERSYAKHKLNVKKKLLKKQKNSLKADTQKNISFVEKKKNWHKLVSKSEIEKVVNEIIDFGVENENDIIALSSRWHSLKIKYHQGVTKEDDFNIENNKIVHALLDFIKNLKDTEGLKK